tara:strand:- start:856 stop:1227 length:372 start_codon:yes stop_codon:yes gene_type:complete
MNSPDQSSKGSIEGIPPVQVERLFSRALTHLKKIGAVQQSDLDDHGITDRNIETIIAESRVDVYGAIAQDVKDRKIVENHDPKKETLEECLDRRMRGSQNPVVASALEVFKQIKIVKTQNEEE